MQTATAAAAQLSPQQLAHLESFGFVVLRQRFDPTEIAEITRLHEEVMAEDRRGQPYDGRQRQAVLGFIERRDELIRLLEDDRLYLPCQQLLGDDFVWIGSDGNYYTGDTEWHSDSDELSPYRRIKILFYLDVLTSDTGALRVVPGSHRAPLFEEFMRRYLGDPNHDLARTFGLAGKDMPGVALMTTPGDVVIFDPNIWHASFGGGVRRRMFALSYGLRPTQSAHDDVLRSCYDFNMGIIKNGYSPHDWMYGPRFLDCPSARIRGMAEPLLRLGFR